MLDQFAKLLGIPLRASEDALHLERLAQATLARRDLFGGALVLLCSGAAMSLPLQRELSMDSSKGHVVFDTVKIVDPLGHLDQWTDPRGLSQASYMEIKFTIIK